MIKQNINNDDSTQKYYTFSEINNATLTIVTYRVILYQLLCAIGYFSAVIHFIYEKLCMGVLIVGHIVRRRIERQGFYGVEPYKCPIKRRSAIGSYRFEKNMGVDAEASYNETVNLTRMKCVCAVFCSMRIFSLRIRKFRGFNGVRYGVRMVCDLLN